MNSNFVCYLGYRENDGYGNSVVKLDIWDVMARRWMTVPDQLKAGNCTEVGVKLCEIGGYLAENGMEGRFARRLPRRKQVFLSTPSLPLAPLLRMGCVVFHYPKKYGVETDEQRMRALADVQQTGLHFDISNCVRSEDYRDLEGRAMLGVIALARKNNIPLRLYVDNNTRTWLHDAQMHEAHSYVESLLEDHSPSRIITTTYPKESIDPIMLYWADRKNGHVLSRDEFDEFDRDYDWILHGAEEGRPRLHKFVRRGNQIGIPDFGLWGDIPTEWPSDSLSA